MKKLQDQKHDMEREIKILHRRLRVRELQRDTLLLMDQSRLMSNSIGLRSSTLCERMTFNFSTLKA